MSLERLTELFFSHDGKIVDKWEQYLPIYAGEFARYLSEGNPVRLLEIGVQNGGSLELWSKYLPEKSEIIGLDIDPAVEKLHFDGRVVAQIADVNDAARLQALLGSELFDIIIDDGSHQSDDIISAFRSLFDRVKPGGVFIVEDLHASYWANHQGGLRREGSAIEFFKGLVDSLAVDHFEDTTTISDGVLAELQHFGRWIDRVSFYDSVAVFQKSNKEKVKSYRRMLSGTVAQVTNPVEGMLAAPPAMVRDLVLGNALGSKLNNELLDRLITALHGQGELRATVAALQGQAVLERERDREQEERDREQEQERRREQERGREQEQMRHVSEIEALIKAHASEREAHGLLVRQLTSDLASLSQSVHRTTFFDRAYLFLKQCERRIRLRIKPRKAQVAPTKAPAETPAVVPDFTEDRTTIAQSGLFDSDWYRANYQDVKDTDPIVHYLTVGAAAGFDPNPLFHTTWYLEKNRDVRDAGANPLHHYITRGAGEGRDPNAFFHGDWFLRQNQDVKNAAINPLHHYLHYGAAENRDPSPNFSSRWYREAYLSQEASAISPLVHYIRYGKAAGHEPKPPNADYLLEVLKQQQLLVSDTAEIDEHIKALVVRPRFSIRIAGDNPSARKETERSLENQMYRDWSLLVSPTDLVELSAENPISPVFFVEVEAGDRLHPTALYEFATAINVDPAVDMVYSDEDFLDAEGRRSRPFFKPDWSPDYLESMNYIGYSSCFRGALAAGLVEAGCFGYDLILRFTEITSRVVHVRKVLLHRRAIATEGGALNSAEQDVEIKALAGRLHRTGREGDIKPIRPNSTCYDIKINLKTPPLVSIVIPTAGKVVDLAGGKVDLLVNCIEEIVSRSSYKHYEIVVVDNGDLSSSQKDTLNKHNVRSITFHDPKFNVAKKLNLGASVCGGELLLLLNDDVEPLHSDWIERLVEHFEKPHVGVVGAKLLYPDQTTQHVGVVLNSCNPDHVRRLKPRDDLGYYFSTAAVRNFVAVTGACMMTRASAYKSVGGYSESLAVSYNDADYCLKVIETGLTVVYAPSAELIHFESQSRQPTLDWDEIDYFHGRWAHIVSDPFYNESELTVASPTYEVKHNARVL